MCMEVGCFTKLIWRGLTLRHCIPLRLTRKHGGAYGLQREHHLDRMEYGAYGMLTYRIGTNDTPFLYNGRYGVQTDPNGLLYMRARYYDPYICRFLNADPSGFGGGLNMYYVCPPGIPSAKWDLVRVVARIREPWIREPCFRAERPCRAVKPGMRREYLITRMASLRTSGASRPSPAVVRRWFKARLHSSVG